MIGKIEFFVSLTILLLNNTNCKSQPIIGQYDSINYKFYRTHHEYKIIENITYFLKDTTIYVNNNMIDSSFVINDRQLAERIKKSTSQFDPAIPIIKVDKKPRWVLTLYYNKKVIIITDIEDYVNYLQDDLIGFLGTANVLIMLSY